VKKNVKNENTIDDFKKCLFSGEQLTKEQHQIQSREHTVSTLKQEKLALDPHDNKRKILNCNIHTLPWGHYKIVNSEAKIICEVCNPHQPSTSGQSC